MSEETALCPSPDEWTPDVVVLDLALPRLDGRDLYYELRSRPDTRHIPIVVVTGSDTSDLDAKVFTSILRKPGSPLPEIDDIRSARSRHTDKLRSHDLNCVAGSATLACRSRVLRLFSIGSTLASSPARRK